MNATELPTPGLGNEVPLCELEKQLKRLWDSEEARTKASLANFAIYCENADSLEANTELIRGVTREHACRALLIATVPDAPEVSVRSWITAHCQLAAGGKKSICSEQITFVISGGSPGLLANTVFSYLESDLPLIFWWQGPFSSRWEPHLYAHIDRLVIDSGAWEEPLSQLQTLEEAWQHAHGGFSVNDLTWTRVLHQRRAIAAAFDQPGAAGILQGLDTVEITSGSGHRLAANMFAAWLMDQAGWTLESGEPAGDRFRMRAGKEAGKEKRIISLRFKEGQGPRAVPRARLSGSGGSVTLTHGGDSAYIHSRIEPVDGPAVEALTPCPCQSRIELVTERLRRGCNTPRYFRILQTVRVLLGENA